MKQLTRLMLVLGVAGFTLALGWAQPPGLRTLHQGSSAVFVGTVSQQHSARDPSGKFILTHTTFRVTRWLKGQAAPTITLTEFGGTVDGVTLENPNRGTYQTGYSYVVFATPRHTGGLRTYFGPVGSAPVTAGTSGEAVITVPAAWSTSAAVLPAKLSVPQLQRAMGVTP